MKSRDQIISDYFSEIRTQIDVITETQIEQLNKARDNLLDKLKQHQTECMYYKPTNQTDFLTKLDEFNKKMNKYLSDTDWNENYVNDQIKQGKNLLDLCSKAKVTFQNEIFLNKKPTFIPSTMTLKEAETIGKLNFEELDIKEKQQENVPINHNIEKFFEKNSIIDSRLNWISNISIIKSKLDKKVDFIYNLKDLNTFISINNNVNLSDSILTFNKDGKILRNHFDSNDKQFVVDTEYFNNFLFLKCIDRSNNMRIFMTHFENNQWSAFLEGGGSSTILNQFHTMAANDSFLYCFFNSVFPQVFPYEYKTNKIAIKEKLPFNVISAKDGCKVKVDRKFFYVLYYFSDNYNEKSVYIHNLNNGIISKVFSKFNIIDICLVEKGLLAAMYFENSNLIINVFAGGDGKMLAKVNLNIGINDKDEMKKLKLISFSKESQVILDQCNSIVYWNHLPNNLYNMSPNCSC